MRICVRKLVTGFLVGLAVSSCANPSSDDASTSTSTLPPAERVTDTAEIGLTDDELRDLEEKCKKEAGVPGTNADCRNLIPRIHPKPCNPPKVSACLQVGRSATDPDVGAVKLSYKNQDAPACASDRIVLCERVSVPVEIVVPLIEAQKATPTSSTTTLPSPNSPSSVTATLTPSTTVG